MAFLINPNSAYILIFAAVMLAIESIQRPRSNKIKLLLVVCLAATGFELNRLQANPWALLITALSPLPFFILTRQEQKHLSLLGLTIVMLTISSTFIFVDQDGRPMVNLSLAGALALFSSFYLWLKIKNQQKQPGLRKSENSDSLVGMVGEARTLIDNMGSVKIDGELLLARSEEPIPAGSLVRVIRCDGPVVIAKKVEKLTK